MAIGRVGTARTTRHRQVFTVPTPSGNYANERVTVGAVAAGVSEGAYQRAEVLVEGSGNSPFVPSSVVEVWFPRLDLNGVGTDQDYTFGGSSYSMTSAGMYAFELGAATGFQVRVKSGGSAGSQAVTVTAS
jgi:hypothetical protein